MAGIAGIIRDIPGTQRNEIARCMVQRMCHDDSQSTGHCDLEQLCLSVGWVSRLGSFSDCLPAWNEDRTVCLVFHGEELSVRDQLVELGRRGYNDLREDASSLVHLYEEQGLRFISRLNGWFSGLVVDLRNDTATLFNDRYGLNRIYYHDSPDGFYFASEAKSLLAELPGLREVDQRSLAEFFSVGCALQNRSLFRGVSLLPGGAQWTFHRDGRVERQQYFRPETWEQQEPLNTQTYGERLQEIFGRVAPRFLRGPSPVGMSLTGGLDSRMLLAWAQATPGSLPCYTFGGPYRDCSDVRIARRLAAICGQPHTTIRIGNDFFPQFGTLAEKTVYLTDGAMDVSGAVELYVNRQAREIAPVRLTGNYGSEILRSNVAFRPGRLNRALFTPEFCRLLDEAADTYRSEAATHRLSFIAFKQVPWHHFGRLAVEQSQLIARSPFLDNELVALAYRVPPELAKSPEPLLALIAAGNPALDTVGTDRALRHRGSPIFTRLAQAWQDFTAKAEYAYDYGMPARLTRIDHFCAPLHLDRLFLGRHKFNHFRIWYKERLNEYLEAFAESSSQVFCYRPGASREIVRAHLTGRANHTLDLHKYLAVQLIEQVLFRSS
jgi:asparagine synthase (glutamine-hydrolysing)